MKRKRNKEIKKMGPDPNKITKKQLATIDFFFVELRNNRATTLSEEDCFFRAYQRAGYRSNRMQANKLFKEKKILKEIKRLRPKKTRGRPRTEFTEDTINKLCDKIEKGMSQSSACKSIKLDINTFGLWLRTGRNERKEGKTEDQSDHVKFLNKLEAADEIGKEKLLDLCWKHADGGHTAKEKTINYNSNGDEVFRSEKVKETLPSFNASKWLLEIKDPEKYKLINSGGFGVGSNNKNDDNINYKVFKEMTNLMSLMMSGDVNITEDIK